MKKIEMWAHEGISVCLKGVFEKKASLQLQFISLVRLSCHTLNRYCDICFVNEGLKKVKSNLFSNYN